MKMRYKLVEVRMQQGASILRKRVPAWEVPVLQAVHPETTEIEDIVHEVPSLSVSSEMARLQLAYGGEQKDGKFTGIPYADSVYGQNAVGLRALRAAIQESVLPADTAVTPDDLSPPIRSDLIVPLEGESADASDLIGSVAA
ncbi:MAG: hypothetical protein KGL39_14740 [Patescibacteria group bacterium]|nr:hypothetical protein [Patescibacteria group bacterium]